MREGAGTPVTGDGKGHHSRSTGRHVDAPRVLSPDRAGRLHVAQQYGVAAGGEVEHRDGGVGAQRLRGRPIDRDLIAIGLLAAGAGQDLEAAGHRRRRAADNGEGHRGGCPHRHGHRLGVGLRHGAVAGHLGQTHGMGAGRNVGQRLADAGPDAPLGCSIEQQRVALRGRPGGGGGHLDTADWRYAGYREGDRRGFAAGDRHGDEVLSLDCAALGQPAQGDCMGTGFDVGQGGGSVKTDRNSRPAVQRVVIGRLRTPARQWYRW